MTSRKRKGDHREYWSSLDKNQECNSTSSLLHHDDAFHSDQFSKQRRRIPWKAICLAVFLFVGGTSALIICILSLAGHLELPPETPNVLLALGLLMFVPGAYHVWIAYWSYQEYPGYSFDDIPDFD